MESKDIQPRSSKSGKSPVEVIYPPIGEVEGVLDGIMDAKRRYIPSDEKIEVEIRELVRIRPEDFRALKISFEEWANQWN